MHSDPGTLGTLVVVPTHNEGGVIAETLRLLVEHFSLAPELRGSNWVIAVIDNGSRSEDAEQTRVACEAYHERVRYICLETAGRGNAFREAIRRFPAERTLFVDADLPLPLDELLGVLTPLIQGNASVVVGRRRPGGRSRIRSLMTRAWSIACMLWFDLALQDPQCGVFAIHKSARVVLAERTSTASWLTNTEFLLVARDAGLSVTEVPITWIENRYPKRRSTVRPLKYGTEAVGFLMQRSDSLRHIAIVAGIGALILASLLYQRSAFSQADFIVAHHIPELRLKLQLYVLGTAALFALMAFPLARSFQRLPWRLGLVTLVMGTCLLWGAAIATPPTRSHDAYWSLSFGKMVAIRGENPYQTPASILTDSVWMKPVTGSTSQTLAHGPLWALIMAGIAALSPVSLAGALLLTKLLMSAALAGAMVVLWRSFGERGTPPNERVARLGLALWSPFLLQAALVDTHNDVLMFLGIAASYYFLLRGRHRASIIALVVVGFIKYVSLLLIPIPLIALMRTERPLNEKLKEIGIIATISLLIGFILYAPFGTPWNIATGLTRQIFDTTSPWFATIASLAESALVGSRAVWFFGIATALGMLAWYLRRRQTLRAYTGPFIMLLTFGTLWLQAWYLLWALPGLILAAPPTFLITYLSFGAVIPDGMTVLEASVLITYIGIVALIKRRAAVAALPANPPR